MDKKSVGDRVRIVRESANLKQEEFALATCVTNVTISRYEKGHRTPDADFLNRLVELYGCDPGWLLTGDGTTPEAKPIDRETAIINKMLEGMTEAQKEDVRKYCEMSKCYAEMKPNKRA